MNVTSEDMKKVVIALSKICFENNIKLSNQTAGLIVELKEKYCTTPESLDFGKDEYTYVTTPWCKKGKIEALAEKLFLINYKVLTRTGMKENPNLATEKGFCKEVKRVKKYSWDFAKLFYEVKDDNSKRS